MRTLGYSLITAAMLTQPVQAQPTPPETLDTVLRGCEKTMTELKNFACVIERTSNDKALDARDELKGYALFVKALKKNDGNLARLQLTKTSNPNVSEKYIFTGSELHEYVSATSEVRVYKLPNAQQAGLPQENLLACLFGMGVEHVKGRYDLELVKPDSANAKFHYLIIRPKTARDKADFTVARLSLYRDTHMPAQIWYSQPNKNEVTWSFTNVQLNVKEIPRKHFEPEVPAGWRVVPVALPALLPKN